jgi:peptide/nickel transport system substrate-binding protein
VSLGGAAAVAPEASTDVDGGTFRVAVLASDFDSLDPALAYSPDSWPLVDATCARLMTYPDERVPAGLRLVREVAAAEPVASADRRTWTFRLRSGFRFSDGTPVRASAFAHAIERTLAPGVGSPGAQFTLDIVGAAAYRAGRTARLTGVTAAGMTLAVRFKHPAADFPARTTMTSPAAIPAGAAPTAIVRTTSFVAGSICETVRPVVFATQTAPSPAAMAVGPSPTAIVRVERVAGAILVTTSSPAQATQSAPAA